MVRDEAAVTIVLASPGYPGAYPKGLPVQGFKGTCDAEPEDVLVFHAGTRLDETGSPVTSGGRVLVTALMPTLDEARSKACRLGKDHIPRRPLQERHRCNPHVDLFNPLLKAGEG